MTPLQLNEARLESLYQWFLTQRRWKSVESEPALFKEAMREFAVETVHEVRRREAEDAPSPASVRRQCAQLFGIAFLGVVLGCGAALAFFVLILARTC